jgi:23S rRNA (adenine2503-C2)-methyltransferase
VGHPRRQIFAEYGLIKGVNDSMEAAEELAHYLQGLRVRLNLIPYNPQSRILFFPPEDEQVEAFAQKMRKLGYQTFIRQTKGQKIMAACGQLGRKSRRHLSKEVYCKTKK